MIELIGRKFIELIQAALSSITALIIIVGAKERGWAGLQLSVIDDIHVKWGALGGLHAALAACHAEWAAIVACDLPFVTGELFVRLASLRENFDAVVPVQSDGRRQPLCALYRTAVCRERAEELIVKGERRPRALLATVRTRHVAFEELMDLDGANNFFINVNTPENYADAREKEGKKG